MGENKKSYLKPFFYRFVNRWSAFSLFLSLLSIILYLYEPSILHFSLTVFLLSVLLSFLIWNIIGGLVETLPKIPAKIVIGLLCLVIPIFYLIGFKVYLQFKVFLNRNLLLFITDDPKYLGSLMEVFFSSFWTVLGYLIISTALFFFFTYKVRYKKRGFVRIFILLLIVAIGQNQFGSAGDKNFTEIGANYIFAIKKYNREVDNILKKRKRLQPSPNRIVPNPGKFNNYNIVLVVQESMSVKPLSFYGYKNNYTPFLQSWINQEKDQFVFFQDAMSISGCTDMSIPTMMTGVGPEHDFSRFMKMPFLWDYAKENGYHTAFITSQLYTWRNLRYFFDNQRLDLLFSAENTNLDFINDVGVDDVAQSKNAKRIIKNFPKNQPIFLVYGTNALHLPYQNHSPLLQIPKKIKSRYGKALYIIDQGIKNIFQAFKERGELNKTIFIFTADHGQYAVKRQSRLGNFYLGALHIPIFIRFPKSWIKKYSKMFKTLQYNQTKRVSNLDLMPTIMNLLGSIQSNKKLYGKLDGKSLCDTISNSRTIIALSTNSFRMWTAEGLGIYKDSFSYIIDNLHQEQLYNLKEDPNQKDNIIKNAPPQFLHEVMQLINNNKQLHRIYKKYAN